MPLATTDKPVLLIRSRELIGPFTIDPALFSLCYPISTYPLYLPPSVLQPLPHTSSTCAAPNPNTRAYQEPAICATVAQRTPLVMSNASHGGKRGGISALRAATSSQSVSGQISHHNSSSSHFEPATSSFLSAAIEQNNDFDPATSQSHVRDFARQPTNTSTAGTLDLARTDTVAQNELLRDVVFPEWGDETGPDEDESPEELAKKDPLGTQIWKLYSRTKTRLPNQERMENLTWRMMAMNLRRRQQEQASYALFHGHR